MTLVCHIFIVVVCVVNLRVTAICIMKLVCIMNIQLAVFVATEVLHTAIQVDSGFVKFPCLGLLSLRLSCRRLLAFQIPRPATFCNASNFHMISELLSC